MKQSIEGYKKKFKKKYIENPHANCGDKKTMGLRPLTRNLLYEIKLHKIT